MVKKQKHPFDSKGGVIVFPISVIKSKNFQTMSHAAQVLMLFMQRHWRETDPVAFGIREAMSVLHCDKRTAIKAMKELRERRFIELVDESFFSSRTQSKARTWRLTWMPYQWLSPTKEWVNWIGGN